MQKIENVLKQSVSDGFYWLMDDEKLTSEFYFNLNKPSPSYLLELDTLRRYGGFVFDSTGTRELYPKHLVRDKAKFTRSIQWDKYHTIAPC